MHRIFRVRSRKAGLPPGSLTSVEDGSAAKAKLSFVEFSENEYKEKDDVTLEECLKSIETPLMTWIHITGKPATADVETIGKYFKLHSLAMEDVLNTIQRPKLDVYQDQVFIIIRYLQFHEAKQHLSDEQISLFFGKNYLISFAERDESLFHTIKSRLQQANNRLRKQGSDYLAYTILDMVVDSYFLVLEKVDERLDKLEEELVASPKPSTLLQIQASKRDMIFLRRSIWPFRDVVNRFMKLEADQVTPTTQLFLQDVYDHLVQTIDIIEGFRDIVAGMLDIYLSNINIRTNEIMKVLTIVSTIFVPLTFIASVYGMNLEGIPGLHKTWGFTMVSILMITIALVMLFFFRRKRWI